MKQKKLDRALNSKKLCVGPQNLILKPSTMPCTWFLKCFVLQHSIIKNKGLRSLIRRLVKGFECVEILGLSSTFFQLKNNSI